MCIGSDVEQLYPRIEDRSLSSPEIRRFLPYKASKRNVKPGLSGDPKSEEGWYSMEIDDQRVNSRIILAEVIRILIVIAMKNHCYRFEGHLYLQLEGGPIGMRSTASIARVVMAV